MCDITIQWWCVILPFSDDLWYYHSVMMCDITIQWWCVILPFSDVWYYHSVMMCDITIQWWFVILPFSDVWYYHSVMCDITIQWWCVILPFSDVWYYHSVMMCDITIHNNLGTNVNRIICCAWKTFFLHLFIIKLHGNLPEYILNPSIIWYLNCSKEMG